MPAALLDPTHHERTGIAAQVTDGGNQSNTCRRRGPGEQYTGQRPQHTETRQAARHGQTQPCQRQHRLIMEVRRNCKPEGRSQIAQRTVPTSLTLFIRVAADQYHDDRRHRERNSCDQPGMKQAFHPKTLNDLRQPE
ncbi:hypothetical protein D3C75_375030 [compost metagenome]